MMKLPEELKNAVSQLPSKEKDKLIFRLLRRDTDLANRLLFELVSDDTVSDRRAELKKKLKADIERATNRFYSPGYLNMDMRYMSGAISEHVRITKDRVGEILLNLYITNEIVKKNGEKILRFSYGKAHKFCIGIVARVFKVMLLIRKQHSDFMIEFEDDLRALGQLMGDNPYLMQTAIHNGLDVNWLLQADIPEDIETIYKDLKAKGYLK